MTITEIIKHHTKQLVKILSKELDLEKKELQDKLHFRTLERIFIEEKQIYKLIEKMKSTEAMEKAILDAFEPLKKELGTRGISPEDVEHLLKIPIRRISLYDINKTKAESLEIQARIKEINADLKNISAYAINFLNNIIAKIKANEEFGRGKRKTLVGAFEKIVVKEIVKKDIQLKYDAETGYLGTGVNGALVAEVSPFDRILTIKNDGIYIVADLSEKTFVGPKAWWIGLADKEVISALVFTLVYKEKETGYPCIKRCIIEGWIMNKEYSLVPEGATVLYVDTRENFSFTAHFKPKPKVRITKEVFKAQDYSIRGLKTLGIRLANREVDGIEPK
jgi:topoisomerase-4 subunit A